MFDFPIGLAQTLATILPIVAASLVILLVAANLFTKIRRRFNVKVNCWFCNQWMKVPYDDRNSFNCPNCMQYNGFDETGGYNREIPAQHDELLNVRSLHTTKRNQKPSANGLCRLCNNNQQLKVYQLANFIPMNEENYDMEIEHFSKQLEKAYKLCTECDNKLKQTLLTQHKWILGLKIKQLKQQGLDTLRNLEKTTKRITQQYNSSYFLTFLNVLIISFASLILMNALYSSGIFEKTTLDLIYPYYESLTISLIQTFDAIYSFVSYLSDLKTEYGYDLRTLTDFSIKLFYKPLSTFNFSRRISEDFSGTLKSVSETDHLPFSICGFILQAIISTFTKRKKLKYAPMILWSLLVILSWHNYNNLIVLYSAQVFATLIIIYMILTENSIKTTKEKSKCTNIWNNVSSLQNLLLQEQLKKESASLNSSFRSKFFDKEDTAESDCSFESITSKSTLKTSFNTCLSSKNEFDVFNGPPVFRSILSPSPVVFKPKPGGFRKFECKQSEPTPKKYGLESYLNTSMDNLHIGTKIQPSNIFKPTKFDCLSVNRPLISPPRLKYNNFNVSNWNVKNFNNGMSRSSSQSSGFVSQTPCATSSPNQSICSDFDYASLFSEPLVQKRKFFDEPV